MPAEAEEVVADPVPQPALNKRKERGADPGPEMPGIPVRGILKGAKGAGSREPFDLRLGKWKQRADQASAGLGADAGQTRRSTASQYAEQDRLDLIVRVMRRHDVPGVQPLLGVSQPRVARLAGFGFRRVGAEVKLSQLEGESH